MHALGLSRGTSGNVSARTIGGMLITPSGVEAERISADDIVQITLTGAPSSPHSARPSSEWRMHAAILEARPEVGAVVHAHPPFGTALAVHGRGIPAFHYMIAVAGGDDIRCAPYATFGTAELAEAALQALQGRAACLLAHHGMVALGATPAEALSLAVEVEALAEQYWRALQIGEPPLLGTDEMARVVERFREYRAGR